jgi:hypothetical protein
MFPNLTRIVLTLLLGNFVFAQSNPREIFNSKSVPTNNGEKIVFCNANKKIELNLFGKKFQKVEINDQQDLSNSYFVSVDDIIIQATLIDLPENVISVYGIKNLNLDQQMQILRGYMDYEIEYLNSDIGPGVKDIGYAEGKANSNAHLVWNYFYKNYDKNDIENGEPITGQFCVSTLAFDKVLTVSIPITKTVSKINPVMILRQIIESVRIANETCE